MKLTIAAALITAAALPTAAYARANGDTVSAGVGAAATAVSPASDPCMLTATVRASYTAAADGEIYGIARKECGYGRPGPADAEAAAAWTQTVAGLRDRRRRQDAMYGLRQIAAR